MKTAKQMERHFKGMANHYRVAMLLLIDAEAGILVEGIAERLQANYKTISQHTRYLTQAGLVNKQYHGRAVRHFLSPYGKLFVRFIKSFQRVGSP
ncbi:MAG: winged helix-turn-helix transcriptional regulator [Candidatus Kerfeldbacteria bacterium]|nr:winged helix-turn-helix transcriptional regulator [Candidatus Kerfeldbacteria bacterium]